MRHRYSISTWLLIILLIAVIVEIVVIQSTGGFFRGTWLNGEV